MQQRRQNIGRRFIKGFATCTLFTSALVGPLFFFLLDLEAYRNDDSRPKTWRPAPIGPNDHGEYEDDGGSLITLLMRRQVTFTDDTTQLSGKFASTRLLSSEPYEDPEASSTLNGIHFVDLYVGNPSQRRTLAIMTGSDHTAFACGDCPDCPKSMPQFQSTESTTFVKVPCGQCLAMGTGRFCSPDGKSCITSEKQADRSSWEGYEAHDVALLGAPRSTLGTDTAARSGFPLYFSCQTSATGRFASQVRDGVISFSPAATSFVSQMHKAGKLKKAQFSLCFERPINLRPASAPSAGPHSDAGSVTLGGYDPFNLKTPMTYAQSVANDGAAGYRVFVTSIYLREGSGPSIRPDLGVGSAHLRKVTFDAEVFNAKGRGMTVDSGAPYTVFHTSAEASFKEMWTQSTGGSVFPVGKMFLTEEELQNLPTIILQFMAFDGVDTSLNPNTIPNMAGDLDPNNPHDALIAFPPSSYMEFNPWSGAYRARISFESAEDTVLGSNAMAGHTILFDLEKKRVGFSKSRSCERVESKDADRLDDDMFTTEEEIDRDEVRLVDTALTDDLSEALVKSATSLSESIKDNVMKYKDDAPEPNVQSLPSFDLDVKTSAQNQHNETTETEKRTSEFEKAGACTSISCRVWVGIGYFFVGCALAIVYRTANRGVMEERLQSGYAEKQHLSYDYFDNSRHYSQGWALDDTNLAEGGDWKGFGIEDPMYGSKAKNGLYDLQEVDEEYERDISTRWK